MPTHTRRQLLAAFAVVYLVWGSTYLAIIIALETLPPFLSAGARHVVAGLLLFAWARGRSPERITRAQLRTAAILGVLMLTFGNGLVVWSEQRIGSGQAALLVTSGPIWITLYFIVRDRAAPPLLSVVGVLLGFIGQVFLVSPGHASAVDPVGAAACLVATLTWTGATIVARHLPTTAFRPLGVSLQMLMGGVVLLGVGLLGGEVQRTAWHAVTLRSVGAWAYLVVFGSLLAFSCYSWLMGVVSPLLASTNTYVNPVVAVVLGWLVLHEPISTRMVVAGAASLAGVVLLSISARPAPRPAPAAAPLREAA